MLNKLDKAVDKIKVVANLASAVEQEQISLNQFHNFSIQQQIPSIHVRSD